MKFSIEKLKFPVAMAERIEGAQSVKVPFDIEPGGWTERIEEHHMRPHKQGPLSFEVECQVSLR